MQRVTGPDLSMNFRIAGDALTLTYTVENRAARDLYLFNRLHDGLAPGKGLRVDIDRVVIEIREQQVVIGKKLVPVPDGLRAEANLPCVTAVAPAGRFTETVYLKLPLEPWTPYAHPRGVHPRNRLFSFEIGYFFARDNPRAKATTVETRAGPGVQFAPFDASGQRLLTIGPLDSVATLEE